METEYSCSYINKLPEEILDLIFEYTCQNQNNNNNNIKQLLNYRLTNKTWKFTIENYSQFMKQLTFVFYACIV